MRILAAKTLSLFRGPIILNIEQAAVSWRFDAADGGLTPLKTAQGELYEALRSCPLKLALRIWSNSWYNTVSFLERTR
jgi:hypothetical protein